MKEIMSNIPDKKAEEIGNNHLSSSYNTPLRPDAFDMDEASKIAKIEGHFKEIMIALGLDLNDDSLSGTPKRVAKMFVQEVFSGLDPQKKPTAKLFENKFGYEQMLVEKNITFYSHCEHHFVPIFGKVHVAYISNGKVIGLSKINRIVQYYAKRPQIQERLTVQIAKELQRILKIEDVGVVIDATHFCITSRGVGDANSKTGTAHFSGKFKTQDTKKEFLSYVNSK